MYKFNIIKQKDLKCRYSKSFFVYVLLFVAEFENVENVCLFDFYSCFSVFYLMNST